MYNGVDTVEQYAYMHDTLMKWLKEKIDGGSLGQKLRGMGISDIAVYGANELGTNMDIYDTDNQDVNLKKKKKKKNPEDEDEVKNFNYSTGKIVPSEDLDKTMMKNFKVCAGMDYFKHEVEDDDDY